MVYENIYNIILNSHLNIIDVVRKDKMKNVEKKAAIKNLTGLEINEKAHSRDLSRFGFGLN